MSLNSLSLTVPAGLPRTLGELKAAMDICKKYGVVPEALLPFHITTTMFLGDENQFYATAAQRRCSAYFNLLKNFSQWRTWLASNGPIMVGLNVLEGAQPESRMVFPQRLR